MIVEGGIKRLNVRVVGTLGEVVERYEQSRRMRSTVGSTTETDRCNQGDIFISYTPRTIEQ